MNKKEFLDAVTHEVVSLKKFATKKELRKLNVESLDPDNKENCIYGQMTGDCSSERAKALMDKSCIIVTMKVSGSIQFLDEDFKTIKKFINGKNEGQGWGIDNWGLHRNYSHLSALEAYICLKNAKNNKIIEFLRGESDKLVL